ncbi:MAG: SoxR reducing system RseC family protein [Deltaproteobacteria bacterium]|jgi:sigma-E factor negative regulatory protein RseC|nr:SoxR reducing system RseC family protein [Deltaproteobacteria bacterium]MCW8892736.1 SoxR reducing system RseC family protein [Deltaproteobacteria bacterium]MCW9050584.1 SoxR reducing system RseC family protein [Deltaproteobacteria bacterium]
MIEEFGTIIELKDQQIAVVQCMKHSACHHCPSSGSCQLGDDNESMLVEALNQAGGKLNDRVKVVTTTKNFLQSSFLLYIVPIIGLLIGAYLGQLIGDSNPTAIDPSLLSALTGVVFLVFTFLAIRFFTRRLKREKFMPTIVAVQFSAEMQGESA